MRNVAIKSAHEKKQRCEAISKTRFSGVMRHLWVQIQAYFRPQNLIASISVIRPLKSHSLRSAVTLAQSLGYDLAENETYVQPFERSSWLINKKRYNCAFRITFCRSLAYCRKKTKSSFERIAFCIKMCYNVI